ncbi:hypothetical protein ACJIZ3_010311 [Penstemon smallii]|uniref:Uncharacterized protein n=1 Tax=Penstemon smallii TaxID=265156 RepID=A0ABD3TFW3_9LAMI
MQTNPEQESYSEASLSQEFLKKLNFEEEIDGDDDDEEEEEEEGEEFSFMCGGANTSPIAAEDAFINGQIKPVYPLFNRDLLLSSEDLPMKPNVKKVFVETPQTKSTQATSSTTEHDEIIGPYCDWSNRKAVEVEVAATAPEGCKKSNSTGFSKIWRFKDLMGRSNSDGRDAFVFLNNGHAPPSGKVEEKVEKKEATVKVIEKVKKTGKSKTTSLSAHEVYLKSKPKVERRRSYLPYKPELMGFFTNVNGGLTKNVHPF